MTADMRRTPIFFHDIRITLRKQSYDVIERIDRENRDRTTTNSYP